MNSLIKSTIVFLFSFISIFAYAEGENQLDLTREIEDISVKVLGGDVRITREWFRGTWKWNRRWDPAVVDSALSMKRGKSNYRFSHSENGKLIYQDRSGNRFLTGAWSWTEGAENVSVDWQGRDGNSIIYESMNPKAPSGGSLSSEYGRATAPIRQYMDKNGVTVYLDRNQDDKIEFVKDHHGNVILTLEWSGNLLASVTDYAGRKVTYKYDNDKLSEVVDVRGYSWKYTYKGSNELYVEQTTPENQVSSYDGETGTSYYPNNISSIKTTKKDKKTSLIYQMEKLASGEVVETWSNDLGETVKKMRNGEVSFTVDFVMNNDKGPSYDTYALRFLGFHSSDGDAGAKYCELTGGWLAPDYSYRQIYGNATDFKGCTFASEACSTIEGGNTQSEICKPAPTSATLIERLPDALDPPGYVKQKVITDARGNKTTHDYDQWKNEVKITYADGTSISRTWHAKYKLPLTETDENGTVTAYDYDEKGNLLTLTEAKGTADERITRYTYDEFGQVKTITTGESATNNTALAITSYEYDQYGNITKVTDPEGNITNYSDYDALGNAKTIIDARSNLLPIADQYTWKSTYDNAGNLLTRNNPYGKGEAYSYNKVGHLESITSASGSKVALTTNANGQPLTMTDDNGKITKIEYDKAGRLTYTTDANDNKTQTFYDSRGRLLRTVDGEGNTTLLNYAENLLRSIQFPTYKEVLEYDSRNRIKQTTQQANSRNYLRKLGYDLSGSLTTSADAQEKETVYEYDALNRIKKVTDADGGITELTYDARDNLLQVKDPEGRLTIYTYDKNNRLLSETKDGDQNTNKQRRYGYDQNGNLTSSINPEQEKTTYELDQANRLVRTQIFANKDQAHPIKIISYNFNEKNHLTGWSQQASATLPEGVTPTGDVISLSETYTYNNLEQLESVSVNFGSFTKTYSYTYYPNGLKKTYTNPESITYTYYYNKNNQLMAVHIPGEGQISWANFDWMVPQTLLLPGGQKISLKYDDFQQMEERVVKKADNTELAKAVYEYDLEQNIKKIEKSEGTFTYNYDNLYRLITADSPDGHAANDETFGYDGVGNRISRTENSTTETPAYNQKNQLDSIESSDGAGDTTFTYNANGHTETQTKNGVTTEYVYNHEERLIAVKRDGNTIADYAYNPHGQRVKKATNGIATWYFYNENGLAAEYSSTGQLLKEYHFHPQKTWMTDPLFQRTITGELYYYHNDHLGTPQQLLDISGNIVWSAQYSAFGKAYITLSTVENNLRFPGQYFDEETGLHQNYFRDYDANTGRYLQEDPLGLASSLNYYAYAYQNPLSFTDPTGEIVPVVAAYLRCVLQCMAIDAAMNAINPNPCYSPDKSAKACALDCVNPWNWIGGGKPVVSARPSKPRNGPPPPIADAPHTIIERSGRDGQYTTYGGANGQRDGTWKQYRGSGQDHGGIERPNVKERVLLPTPKGPMPSKPQVRKPEEDEYPGGGGENSSPNSSGIKPSGGAKPGGGSGGKPNGTNCCE